MDTSWREIMLPQIQVACLVPCGADKAPLEKAWQQKGYTAKQIAAMGNRVRSVGINTAKANLVCVDLDGPDAFEFIEQRGLPLPQTWVIGRTTDPNRMKRVYRVSKEQNERLPQDAGKWKKGSLEVFWRSQQFIVMGEHPSGGVYTWDGTPDQISDLPDEWVDFLPRRKSQDMPLPEVREIDLQQLLTRENSQLVDSGLPVGDRNNSLFKLASDAYAAEDEARRRITSDIRVIGTAEDLIGEVVNRTDMTGFSRSEIEATLRSAREGRTLTRGFEDRWSYSVGKSRKAQSPLPGRKKVAVAECKFASIAQLLPDGYNERGLKTSLDAGGLSLILEQFLGERLRYNELGYMVELDDKPLQDIERLRLLCGIQNRGYKISDQTLMEALQAAAHVNAYHPVRQYLARVASDPAVGVIDTLTLSTELIGTESMLFDVMLERCLLGAVWRALEPGCKMDYVCVLHGDQGWGKTTFWQILFGDWFKVFNAELGDKDSYMALHDSWGIELGEIDGITSKKESAKLKNFASTSVDCFRPPYGRVTERFKRPSILVGSCNRDDFLNDSTGERRYWVIPVPTGKRLDRDKLCRMRDAIWKSIWKLYQRGELPFLPEGIEKESEINNISYSRESILLPHLQRYLEGKRVASKTKVREFVCDLDLVPVPMIDKEIMSTMVQLCWKNHKFRGLPRIWCVNDESLLLNLRNDAAALDHTPRGRFRG